MKLSQLQDAIYSYSKGNSLFLILLNYSKIIAFIYPIFLILSRFTVFSVITTVIACISTILLIAHYIGMILCFGKKDMITIALVFSIKSLYYLIWQLQMSVSINDMVGMISYAALAWLSFNCATHKE